MSMSIGESLRSAREAKGISVSEVARRTNIQAWILESLEEDSLRSRMGLIYVRGFLAKYANYLKIDPDSLLSQLPRADADFDEPVNTEPVNTLSEGFSIPWSLFAGLARPALAVACIIAFVVVKPYRWLSLPQGTGAQLASVAGFGDSGDAGGLEVLDLEPAMPLELKISAKRKTWIQLWADEKLLVQQQLDDGSEEAWTAQNSFKLVVARPSQIELNLNGIPITPSLVGNKGRIEITHQGISPVSEHES